jgi:hypothetical protein
VLVKHEEQAGAVVAVEHELLSPVDSWQRTLDPCKQRVPKVVARPRSTCTGVGGMPSIHVHNALHLRLASRPVESQLEPTRLASHPIVSALLVMILFVLRFH